MPLVTVTTVVFDVTIHIVIVTIEIVTPTIVVFNLRLYLLKMRFVEVRKYRFIRVFERAYKKRKKKKLAKAYKGALRSPNMAYYSIKTEIPDVGSAIPVLGVNIKTTVYFDYSFCIVLCRQQYHSKGHGESFSFMCLNLSLA